ncbi:neurogenic protein big brain-like isoform X2 [Ornithodoros turicata]|uniref:neurogenic protein big brain-like isoform X2 n=1 Tax=Ornithodoros turicata TaxID=34597 RepID=UPI003139A08E
MAVATLETLFLQLLTQLERSSRAERRSMRDEIRTLELWRAVIGECLATFFYVFLVCGAHVSWPGYAEPSELVIALTAGTAVATLVQCYGHISGAHLNPAVTLAMVATRKVSPLRALLYITAQCGGAIAGAALLYGVTVPGHQSSLGSSRPHEALGAWQAFGVEFVLTFLLVSTVFASRDPNRNHLGGEGLPIGFAYLSCTLTGLPASGASMNPARSLGPAFVMNKWMNHWVYWFGPVAGGLLAGLIYEFIFDTKKSTKIRKRGLEDTDRESAVDDDYEDPESKITKYASVPQGPNNSTYRSQQPQYDSTSGYHRPAGGNTYSPTPSTAFPASTESTYGGANASYSTPIYGTRCGNSVRTLPMRLDYGPGPGSTKF